MEPQNVQENTVNEENGPTRKELLKASAIYTGTLLGASAIQIGIAVGSYYLTKWIFQKIHAKEEAEFKEAYEEAKDIEKGYEFMHEEYEGEPLEPIDTDDEEPIETEEEDQ